MNSIKTLIIEIQIVRIVFLVLFITSLAFGLIAQEKQDKDTTKLKVISKSQENEIQGLNISGEALSKYIDENFPNSWAIPGTDVRFAITGYVKLTTIVDLDYIASPYSFYTSAIPLEGSVEAKRGGQTTFHARETKLRFDFRSKSARGTPMRAYVSGDFYDEGDPSGTFKYRLRHAFFQISNLTVGQTWTTIADLSSLPTILDWAAGDALVGNRAPLIRWEQQAGDYFTWAVALEQGTSSIGNPYGLSGEIRPYTPNFVGRVVWNKNNLRMQLGAQTTQLRWVNDNTELGTSTAIRYGINFTGRYHFTPKATFYWGTSYGIGWGGLVLSLIGDGSDAIIEENGQLNTFPSWVGNGGLEVLWLPNLASTFAIAWSNGDSPEGRSPDAMEAGGAYHVNLRYSPIRMFEIGTEYMGGMKRVVDGRGGNAQRILISGKLLFM